MKLIMKRIMLFIFIFVFISCSNEQKTESIEEVSASGKHYQSAGKVVSVVKSNKGLIVDHDEIPGFMGAMTMGLRVKDTTLLEGVQPNDSIKFTLTVAEGEMYISKLQKVP